MDRTHQSVTIFCSLLLFLALLVTPLKDGTYTLVLDASGDQIDFSRLLMEIVLISTIYGAFHIAAGSNPVRLKAGALSPKEVRIFGYVSLAVCLLLLWAFDRHPYQYYIHLRYAVCGAGLYGVYLTRASLMRIWQIIFLLMACLYNPIFPVHLERSTWEVVNVVTGITFVLAWMAFRRTRDQAASMASTEEAPGSEV